MLVEIYSDVVCPWCYIGKRRFEEALRRFAHADQVEVEWRAFELDPAAESAAAGEGPDYADRLARKYGTSRAGAQQMLDSMTEAATAEGLDFHFDRAAAANTFAAHQVIHLAAQRGVQDQVKERLLRGYFTQGEPVGDRSALVRLAAEAGLDADEVAQALDSGRHADAVRAEQDEARALGIGGVPFFVVDRRYGVSGAQPAEQLLQVLERAWEERRPTLQMAGPTDGGACGPDGCAL